MSKSIRFSMMAAVVLSSLSFTSLLFAQTQASCSFTTFNPPANDIYGFYPNGINHYNTVVGGVFGPNQNQEQAYIRFSGGNVTLFQVPNSAWTFLTRRNLNGVSVGAYGSATASVPPATGSRGLMYTASSYSTLDYPGASGTTLTGINKWTTIVGTAVNSSKATFGFKYQHGTFTKIQYPGAAQTTITGINDNGVIVGTYQKSGSQTPLGFVLQNGTFKSLNYIPVDINNAGTIVEGNQIHFANGTAKGVYYPGSANTFVGGINDLGVITGGISYGTFEFQGFTATCK